MVSVTQEILLCCCWCCLLGTYINFTIEYILCATKCSSVDCCWPRKLEKKKISFCFWFILFLPSLVRVVNFHVCVFIQFRCHVFAQRHFVLLYVWMHRFLSLPLFHVRWHQMYVLIEDGYLCITHKDFVLKQTYTVSISLTLIIWWLHLFTELSHRRCRHCHWKFQTRDRANQKRP